MLTCTLETKAGYRNVKKADVDDQEMPIDATVERVSSSQWDEVVIRHVGADAQFGETIVRTAGRSPRFGTINVRPGRAMQITLKNPALASGSSVFAYTVHGGRINGEVATPLKVGSDGSVTFMFTVGRWLGNYPLIVRHAGREEVLEFWVREKEGEE